MIFKILKYQIVQIILKIITYYEHVQHIVRLNIKLYFFEYFTLKIAYPAGVSNNTNILRNFSLR